MTPFSTDTAQEVLLRLPLFRNLNQEELGLLLPGVREYKVGAHEMLFQKGDQLRGIHVMVSGQAKLFIPTAQGTEKVIAMVNPGDVFGEAVVFLERPVPVSAEATQDSLLLIVSKEALLAVLDRSTLFARKMLASLSMRLHELMTDMEACTLMGSVQRVACYLSHQIPENRPAQFDVKLDTSKQMLASRLSLAPETLSRALHHLVTAGLIAVKGRTIRVNDAQRLKEYQG
ncbi:MAG: Crp/Fnr family transcriptional regulator [Thiobacillus sp.]